MATDWNSGVKELRERSGEELVSLIGELQSQLVQTKFQHALGQLQESHKIKGLGRSIARAKTLLVEKQA